MLSVLVFGLLCLYYLAVISLSQQNITVFMQKYPSMFVLETRWLKSVSNVLCFSPRATLKFPCIVSSQKNSHSHVHSSLSLNSFYVLPDFCQNVLKAPRICQKDRNMCCQRQVSDTGQRERCFQLPFQHVSLAPLYKFLAPLDLCVQFSMCHCHCPMSCRPTR